MVRNLIQNMVDGVTKNFSKDLEIQGVGFRAELKGKALQLSLGFSHPVLFPIPEGIQIQVNNQTRLTVQGCDKALVGQISANIRGLKPPEPYQGKGIRYVNEVVRRKVGKAAAGAAGG
ncbi:MAG: 50S ribosomal protein L6 [Deltaproteobacteria bacterium RIFCSPLOWO2_02_FULL_46_8]|nr:MAG: 50S ribosomal protein L6 [Deltaproteobacteria bacterium RIFCSPLOWO2_02_FULL_46_8]